MRHSGEQGRQRGGVKFFLKKKWHVDGKCKKKAEQFVLYDYTHDEEVDDKRTDEREHLGGAKSHGLEFVLIAFPKSLAGKIHISLNFMQI